MLVPRRAAGGEDEAGPVHAVLDARGHDADHAFVEIGVEHADGGRRRHAVRAQALGHEQGLLAHAAFQLAALAVDGVQHLGQVGGAARIVCGQALDADGHVGQPACCIDARAQGKAEVEGGGRKGLAAGRVEQGLQARLHLAPAYLLEAQGDQAAVVGVQPDHVGHRAQGDQGQQGLQTGLAGLVEAAARAQFGSQGQQHVEHHADTGHGLALEAAAGLVGVDDGIGQRQVVAGQVVVGDDHLQAQGLGLGHAFDAGNAVVHGDHHLGAGFLDAACDGRRQAVAVHHAVGHQVADLGRAQHAQAAPAHGAGGGTVAVVVGHDAQAQAALYGIGQQPHGGVHAQQARGGQQARGRVVQFVGGAHAACGVELGQQRVDTGLAQCPGLLRRDLAGNDFHGQCVRACGPGRAGRGGRKGPSACPASAAGGCSMRWHGVRRTASA